MTSESYDVVVVGGGLGGVAAAKSAADGGACVLLTEETAWIGGQLTSQAVPPDEHPWIEEFGCTLSYRELRAGVREIYRNSLNLRTDVPTEFNPGSGWVSKICARPDVWHRAMQNMLQDHVASGRLTIRLHTVVSGGSQLSTPPLSLPISSPIVHNNKIQQISLVDLRSNEVLTVKARYVIDATELGDLLPLTGTRYVLGCESREDANDPSGSKRQTLENQQAFTWVFAMSSLPGGVPPIERPAEYEQWKSFQPPYWPGPLFALQDLDPITNEPRKPPLPLFSETWRCWFKYRQIVDPVNHVDSQLPPVTIVNWPQNDYFSGSIVDVDPHLRWARLQEAKNMSACFLHYLQTECPNLEGGFGYPNLSLNSEFLGSPDGFALTPYIRESRRIVAQETIVESDVAADCYPGEKLARKFSNSVGVGSYRIDLHPTTGGDAYIDLATLPFQIPLGALIPVQTKNLIPACKNIGTTHITNGCYRLHPVEWNIGEVAGSLAAFCIQRDIEPSEIYKSPHWTATFQESLLQRGVEINWPESRL